MVPNFSDPEHMKLSHQIYLEEHLPQCFSFSSKSTEYFSKSCDRPLSSLQSPAVLVSFSLLSHDSLIHSRTNAGRPAAPGKIHQCSMLSLFLDYSSNCGSLPSQSFVTLPTLIAVSDLVSHLLLNYFLQGTWCTALRSGLQVCFKE